MQGKAKQAWQELEERRLYGWLYGQSSQYVQDALQVSPGGIALNGDHHSQLQD
jgi:hypothetical protein